MKIVYLKDSFRLEQELLTAYMRRDGNIVTVNNNRLVLPVIANFSNKEYTLLKRGLGNSNFKDVVYPVTALTPQEVYAKVGERIKLILNRCISIHADLIVIYARNADVINIKGAIELCQKQ